MLNVYRCSFIRWLLICVCVCLASAFCGRPDLLLLLLLLARLCLHDDDDDDDYWP